MLQTTQSPKNFKNPSTPTPLLKPPNSNSPLRRPKCPRRENQKGDKKRRDLVHGDFHGNLQIRRNRQNVFYRQFGRSHDRQHIHKISNRIRCQECKGVND